MKTKPSKPIGSRGGEKQKASAVASSPFLIPIEHQEDLQAKSAELPVLKVPESPKQGEHTTFNGIFERLSGAQRFGKGLKLSYSEVDLIYRRFLLIEQRARRLPASIEKSAEELPPEVLEFVLGSPISGTFEADAERNRKWVDFLFHRAWQYFHQIPKKILLGPSGAEKEAAETTAKLIFRLIGMLRHAARITVSEKLVGRDAAKEAYETVLRICHRTVETSNKRERRNAEYAKRGGKKAHRGDFAFLCGDRVRDMIFIHEDWLENAEGAPPTFAKFPSPMPAKRFGVDALDRAEWENWIFLALEHTILKAAQKGSSMKEQWRSHRSDLKNRLIPSYWDKAPVWRQMREHFEQDS
jgi:hypothetical protein